MHAMLCCRTAAMAIHPTRLAFALPPFILLAFAQTCCAEDWPTFRGPHRTAVAPDTNLLEAWPADGPRVVWETAGAGRGYASLAIAGNKIYTLGDEPSTATDADEYLTCFDRATGKQLWMTKTGPAWNEGQESWRSSRSTPTVDGRLVYVLSAFGKLLAFETKDGKEVFQVDLKAQYGGMKGDSWGYSESVLIDGNTLACTPGGEKATVIALNKQNGTPIWACPVEGERGAGHASIVISSLKGRKIYVQTTASGALGVDAKTGTLLWTYPIEQTTAVIPTPIVRDDLVFFSAGYGRGGALLRQVPGPSGSVAIEEIYGLKKDLANKHGGVVLVGDHLYGDSEDKGILFCAELMTGNVVWKQRGSGKGSASVVAADGHIYVRFADGTLALVKAHPEAYAEISTFQIPHSENRPSWSHAVVLDGRLYLREQDAIVCYDIRKK